ncbi:MAG: hypothetical protein LBL87_06670 [Ruminococcus sp.]|jgi:hypothetical protein|nr:hypothetical protein [Ruminococcus sp.]
MEKDLTLHGNAARTGGTAKRETGRNITNTAAWRKGQPNDEEFAKKEVDNLKL